MTWLWLLLTGLMATVVQGAWPWNTDDKDPELYNPHSENGGKDLILVMGLPRSASSSIHDWFECHGISSNHYCCGKADVGYTKFPCNHKEENGGGVTCGACVYHNLNNSQPAFQNCGNVQVFAQFDVETGDPFTYFLPQHFLLPLLHEQYPHATWILNYRETPMRWATNVMHWYSVTNRFFNAFGIWYHKDIDPNDITIAPKHDLSNQVLHQELQKSIERANDVSEHNRRTKEIANIYEKHLRLIRDFVKEHPTHKLIEINVDDPENVQIQLKQAFPDLVPVGVAVADDNNGQQPQCWRFDAEALDNDWKDFSFKL